MQSVPHTRSATDRSASRRIDWAQASRRRGAPRARRRAAASPGAYGFGTRRAEKSRDLGTACSRTDHTRRAPGVLIDGLL